MKTTTLSILLLTSLLLPSRAATDAEAEPGKILSRLQSERPSEIAWGAYLAGQHGVEEAVPLLVDLLRPHPDRDSKDWEYVDYAVLDGLIRLNARAPGHLLLHHARGKGWNPAVILLAREPEKNLEQLLAIFKRSRPDHLWNGLVAIGNLLSEQRAPGFAADLLGRIPFELQLTVTDPEDERGFGGSRSLGAGSGDGFVRLPEGFPPYARYLIWVGARDGATLLADGLHPVYYTRREYERSGLATGVDGGRLVARDCAIEWLAALLGREIAERDIPRRAHSTLRFITQEAYVEEAVAARDRLLAPWRSLVTECLGRKLLTRDEAAGLAPAVEVRINDRRSDKATPLPELPADRWKPTAPAEVDEEK